MPFYAKALLSMLGYQAIVAGKITFGEAEIVNCIQQVCFPYTIPAANANHPFCKNEILVKIIFELEK